VIGIRERDLGTTTFAPVPEGKTMKSDRLASIYSEPGPVASAYLEVSRDQEQVALRWQPCCAGISSWSVVHHWPVGTVQVRLGRLSWTEPRPDEEEDTHEQHEDPEPQIDVDSRCFLQLGI
jgi:hypothetical protein